MQNVQGLTSFLLLTLSPFAMTVAEVSTVVGSEANPELVSEVVSEVDKPRLHSLQAKPNRCIALHQGQVCYQKIKFHWEELPSEGDYCLLQSSQNAPIICWKGNNLLQYTHKFKSSNNEIFVIRDERSAATIDRVSINVAWVYKSRRKLSASWRIF